jgi:hypothetical protein
MSATQFPPAASPQSTSLPPVAQTPTGVVSADGVAARATGGRLVDCGEAAGGNCVALIGNLRQ